MEDVVPQDFKNETFVIVIAATHGEGDPTDNSIKFHKYIK